MRVCACTYAFCVYWVETSEDKREKERVIAIGIERVCVHECSLFVSVIISFIRSIHIQFRTHRISNPRPSRYMLILALAPLLPILWLSMRACVYLNVCACVCVYVRVCVCWLETSKDKRERESVCMRVHACMRNTRLLSYLLACLLAFLATASSKPSAVVKNKAKEKQMVCVCVCACHH